jgi:GDPmannose 4,6-dehydratase
MKALIFGANGQDGHYLVEECRLNKIEPIGVSRSGNWLHVDVSNYPFVESLVKEHKPSHIFHVAANSSTRHDTLFENHETISTGTLNILEAVKKHSLTSRVFITGSGVQFKNNGNPISENDEFEASSPYSLSRIHSVYAARYFRSLGLRAYVGYLFHHESLYRKPSHVSKMVTLAVQRIAAGSNEQLELGDISVQKEWTFAGDVAKGIFALTNQDAVFEATIGSGITYSIEDWLNQCFSLVNLNWRNYVSLRKGFKPEYKRLVSNPATMNKLGWFPTISFPELARIMLDSSLK